MAKSNAEIFRKMSDNELANYYVDVCAYHNDQAVKEQISIRVEIADRFVEKFADKRIEHHCGNCYFYNSQLDNCDRLGGCIYN